MLRGILLILLVGNTLAWADGEVGIDYNYPEKPNPEVTMGDLCNTTNPDFAGYRYAEKIAYCARNVTWERKKKIYDEYGVPENCRKQYTIDHFIPLALGGSNEEVNLWPEHKNVKATRQSLEQELFEKISRGEITQLAAIKVIKRAKKNPEPSTPDPCY